MKVPLSLCSSGDGGKCNVFGSACLRWSGRRSCRSGDVYPRLRCLSTCVSYNWISPLWGSAGEGLAWVHSGCAWGGERTIGRGVSGTGSVVGKIGSQSSRIRSSQR